MKLLSSFIKKAPFQVETTDGASFSVVTNNFKFSTLFVSFSEADSRIDGKT